MPDENDIVFEQQTFDLVGLIEAIFRNVGVPDVTIMQIISFFDSLWGIFVILSFLLATLFFVGYVYAAIRFNELSDVQYQEVREMEKLWQQTYGTDANQMTRMQEIMLHVGTDNPNDWRLAIIEADIELERALNEAGYRGATLGETLKSITTTQLESIRDAWDAHMVRNKIAHAGADFVLTKKITQETITKYQRVFTELGHK